MTQMVAWKTHTKSPEGNPMVEMFLDRWQDKYGTNIFLVDEVTGEIYIKRDGALYKIEEKCTKKPVVGTQEMSTTPVGGFGMGKIIVDSPSTPMRGVRTPPPAESTRKTQLKEWDLEGSYLGQRGGKIYLTSGTGFLDTGMGIQGAHGKSTPKEGQKLITIPEARESRTASSIETGSEGSEGEREPIKVPLSNKLVTNEGAKSKPQVLQGHSVGAQTSTATLTLQQEINEAQAAAGAYNQQAVQAKQCADAAAKEYRMTADAVAAKELAEQAAAAKGQVKVLQKKQELERKNGREEKEKLLRQQQQDRYEREKLQQEREEVLKRKVASEREIVIKRA
ncbi:MAG: hypothetical protein MJE68_18390, partial [Proteobacteria bacterium]|nr:hypothetical protein [Pseudomonadota bacterium]